MTVRVHLTVQTNSGDAFRDHVDADHFDLGGNGMLTVFGPVRAEVSPRSPYGEAMRDLLATYAPGCWASAEKLPALEPVNETAASASDEGEVFVVDVTDDIGAFSRLLRKVIRAQGAKSFGLKPDDGPAGVREPRR